MQILINTDKHINSSAGLEEHVRETVNKALNHFSDHITRVEVHLSDEKADKSGLKEHRCLMEVRPSGLQPIAVTQNADNMHQAIVGAAERLRNAVSNHLGKLQDR